MYRDTCDILRRFRLSQQFYSNKYLLQRSISLHAYGKCMASMRNAWSYSKKVKHELNVNFSYSNLPTFSQTSFDSNLRSTDLARVPYLFILLQREIYFRIKKWKFKKIRKITFIQITWKVIAERCLAVWLGGRAGKRWERITKKRTSAKDAGRREAVRPSRSWDRNQRWVAGLFSLECCVASRVFLTKNAVYRFRTKHRGSVPATLDTFAVRMVGQTIAFPFVCSISLYFFPVYIFLAGQSARRVRRRNIVSVVYRSILRWLIERLIDPREASLG